MTLLNFKPVLFFKQVKQEILRVTWPSRQETLMTSLMVIILSVIAAVFFLITDGLISFIISMILG